MFTLKFKSVFAGLHRISFQTYNLYGKHFLSDPILLCSNGTAPGTPFVIEPQTHPYHRHYGQLDRTGDP